MSERSGDGTDTRPLARTCDLLFGGLVTAVVLLDGALGVVLAGQFLTPGTSAPAGGSGGPVGAAVAALPVGGSTLRWWFAGLAVAAVVVAAVGAGLRSRSCAAVGAVGAPLAVVYSVTGLVLPWNQLSYWLARTLLELFLAVPGGAILAELLFGGVTLGRETLRRAFLLHYALLALAAPVGLLALVPPRSRRRLRARFDRWGQ